MKAKSMKNIQVEVSVGEFLDKMVILEIKSERIKDPQKLKSIHKELDILRAAWKNSPFSQNDLTKELAQLKQVNETLWEIEDEIRDKERHKTFDEGFIELARSVYINNDERAAIKKAINLKVGSELVEEKSYASY
jgi:hypothetical protein